jgi:sodium transport system permease protein
MRWSVLKVLFWKELLDVIRDTRTVIGLILVPVLMYPVLLVGFSHVLASRQSQVEQSGFHTVIEGAEHAPELMAMFRADAQVLLEYQSMGSSDEETLEEKKKRVQDNDLQLIVIIPDGFEPAIRTGNAGEVSFVFSSVSDYSMAARNHVAKIVEEYRDDVVAGRLADQQLPEDFVRPVNIEYEDMADAQDRGAFILGRIVSMLVILMAAMGAFYPAVDMASGEKERGTMETLLVSPATRLEIVTGKYLAVTLVCITTAVMNLVSMGITFSSQFTAFLPGQVDFSPSLWSVAAIFLGLVPMAAMFSALSLGLSSFASSYKEAMLYMSPLMTLAMIGSFAPLLPGVEFTTDLAMIPVVNSALVTFALLQGKATAWLFFATLGSNMLMAFLAIVWTKDMFEQESMLTRGGGEINYKFWTWEHEETLPSATQALITFLLAFAVFFSGGSWLVQVIDFPMVAVNAFAMVLSLLLVPFIIVMVLKVDSRRTFHLKRPPLGGLVAGMGMAMGWIAISITALTWMTNQGWLSPELMQESSEIYAGFNELGLGLQLLIMAIVPAICEEFLYRGIMLSSFAKRYGNAVAIILVGCLFAVMHQSPIQKVMHIFLGMILAWSVLKTGSIWVGVGMHFLNNAFVVILSWWAGSPEGTAGASIEESDAYLFEPWQVAIAVVALGLGAWMMARQRNQLVEASSSEGSRTVGSIDRI